jgi:hypothetical protein
VQSLLVKPIGTQDLLRQIEVLLIQQQDEKQALERSRLSPEIIPEQKEQKAS